MDMDTPREEVVKAIDSISHTMKGPLTNVVRAWLHEDRQGLRELLAKIDAKAKAEPPDVR